LPYFLISTIATTAPYGLVRCTASRLFAALQKNA